MASSEDESLGSIRVRISRLEPLVIPAETTCATSARRSGDAPPKLGPRGDDTRAPQTSNAERRHVSTGFYSERPFIQRPPCAKSCTNAKFARKVHIRSDNRARVAYAKRSPWPPCQPAHWIRAQDPSKSEGACSEHWATAVGTCALAVPRGLCGDIPELGTFAGLAKRILRASCSVQAAGFQSLGEEWKSAQ